MLGAVINLVRHVRFFTTVEVQFEKRPTAGRVEVCSKVTALILGPETKCFFAERIGDLAFISNGLARALAFCGRSNAGRGDAGEVSRGLT